MGNDALDNLTLFKILTRHPLVCVATFVMIPYNILNTLQNSRDGIIHPHAAVHGTNTPRQVLILSPKLESSSGSIEMSTELQTKLSLEIGHGYSDAAWDFTRDDTISWFHGIQFSSQPKDTLEKMESVMKICYSGIASHTEMDFIPCHSAHQRITFFCT